MKDERKVTDRLLIIGDQMANACFNLSQTGRSDITMEPRLREMMIEMRVAWDEERKKCRDQERKAKASKGDKSNG